MEEIHRALGMGCGGEDRPLVPAQELEPVSQVGGVILARLGRDAEIRAQEGSAQLGDEFLAGVARVAEALPAEVAVEAARMLGPVRQLVRLGGGIALGVTERLGRGQLDEVRTGSVVGQVPAVTDDGTGRPSICATLNTV